MKYLVIIFLVFCSTLALRATHNRAGEITYEQLDELTIKITITTYTKTSAAAADRDSLEVFWGDGSSEFVQRSNGRGFPLPNDVKLNTYEAIHTYPGRATYTVYFTDPNRVSNILNVNPPNSVDIPFFLSTTFTLLDPQFQGFNNSAVLLQAPLDFACVGRTFVHNPNAFDIDGDSLSYEFIVPLQGPGDEVPNYINLENIGASPDNNISLDPVTGTFTWDSPQIQGEYNIAFRINEYRDGVLITSIIRDMQILVKTCENLPPTIDTEEEICVVAGEKIEIDIKVDDPDQGQQVIVAATGGPFEIIDSAEFIAPTSYMDPTLDVKFSWQTTCNHISDTYYQVVLRAVDNYFGDSTGLATLKTIRIKVVGPPPENLTGFSTGQSLRLEWELPYLCENADEDYFQGFSIWRKIESQNVEPDTCNPGLDGYGYEKIVFVTNENDGNVYYYEDSNVSPRTVYCYRILAEFAKSSATGNPFNRVESLPSNEICLILKRDIPFLTEANVITTDNSEGSVRVTWTKPVAEDLDTLENPGPYTYQLQRLSNGNFIDIPDAVFTSFFFAANIDTSYFDSEINTRDEQHTYRVAFYTNGNTTSPFGYSPEATTVFLTTIPSDQVSILSWEANTPWNNYKYGIYRQDNFGNFSLIGSTNQNTYEDRDVINGEEYCYLIISEGSYGSLPIISPLINNSQESCTIPFDSVAPCPPIITVENLCEEVKDDPGNIDIGNTVIWDIDENCSTEQEIYSFNIYFSSVIDGPYEIIGNSSSSFINEFFHSRDGAISGCYAVTAIDSLDNESSFSNIVCVENCPGYLLPNTFTPNSDQSNDLFVPRVNRFIDEVDFQVFNQWGNKVFETKDPEINWSGESLDGNKLNEGVYYYICEVKELQISGELVTIEVLRGHINLIR